MPIPPPFGSQFKSGHLDWGLLEPYMQEWTPGEVFVPSKNNRGRKKSKKLIIGYGK